MLSSKYELGLLPDSTKVCWSLLSQFRNSYSPLALLRFGFRVHWVQVSSISILSPLQLQLFHECPGSGIKAYQGFVVCTTSGKKRVSSQCAGWSLNSARSGLNWLKLKLRPSHPKRTKRRTGMIDMTTSLRRQYFKPVLDLRYLSLDSRSRRCFQ